MKTLRESSVHIGKIPWNCGMFASSSSMPAERAAEFPFVTIPCLWNKSLRDNGGGIWRNLVVAVVKENTAGKVRGIIPEISACAQIATLAKDE